MILLKTLILVWKNYFLMNKYIYSESPQERWPIIKSIFANSYNDAIEKLITKFGNEFEDDTILNDIDNWEMLREYLNGKYYLALSDLELYEEI